MNLRVQLPAGVVPVLCDHHVAGGAVLIRAVLPHSPGRQAFHLAGHFPHGLLVRFKQPRVDHRLNRNRFRRRHRKVVQAPCRARPFALSVEAIRALPGPKKLSRGRIETLPDRVELFHPHFAFEAQQLRSLAYPSADHFLVFRVVIVRRQVPRGVRLSSR